MVCAQEADLKEKKKFFYLHQDERFIGDKDFLQAYTALEKLYDNFRGEEFTKQKESLQDSIFSVAISCQENFNADKAVEYLKFYTLNFEKRKAQVYDLLSDIYAQAGEQEKADFYAKQAKEFK